MKPSPPMLVAMAAFAFRAAFAAPAAAKAPLPFTTEQTTRMADAQLLTIQSNTQATVGDLRLAVFNIRQDAYKDETGGERRALTAALQIFVRDDESKDQRLRVHVGQTVVAAGRSIEILAIEAGSVRLAIK